MSQDQHASIAVFGYRKPPSARFPEIVHSIDAVLQKTDAEPRKITWPNDHSAMIDRIGVRIALGLLQPTATDPYTHLMIAVGNAPKTCNADNMLSISHAHLADRLVGRVKDDMPYDTIMRGETPEYVGDTLIEAMFDLLRQTAPEGYESPSERSGTETAPFPAPAEEPFDVILAEDVPSAVNSRESWVERRATPTRPLRLTIHTMALSVMMYTPPLGAFLFTYSMLRDVTDN